MTYAKRNQVVIPREHKRPKSAPWIGKYANEQWLEDRIGPADMWQAYNLSQEMHIPLPIAGTGAFMYKGAIYPAIAGGAGFSSLSDLINEATAGGKLQPLIQFNKVGTTGVANRASTLWYPGVIPGVGATAAALAAGTDFTRTSVGAIGPQYNASGTDTLHLIGAEGNISVVSQGLLLYDRIWAGEPALSTNTAQTVTSTLVRYAGTGSGGTSVGNFAFCECRGTLTGGTGNISIQYTDDAGNGAETSPTITGVAAVANQFCYNGQVALTLNSGDAGLSDISQFTNTSDPTAGSFAVCVGHPLMYIPGLAIANSGYIRDGINSAFNFQRVYDNACLALIEPIKPATTATTYTGYFTLCSG